MRKVNKWSKRELVSWVRRKGSLNIDRIALAAVLVLSVAAAAPAQDRSDPVLDVVESIAEAAGELVPRGAERLSSSLASDGITIGVELITYDNGIPTIAEFLRSVIEDEVLNAAVASGSIRPITVVREDGADLQIRVQGASGADRALFTIQMADAGGQVLASARRSFEWSPQLDQAFLPVVATVTGPGGGSTLDDVPDRPDQARSVTIDSVHSGLALNRSGDQDWFVITAPPTPSTPGGAIPALTAATTGPTDTYIEVYGPDSYTMLIGENDDFNGSNASYTFQVQPGARYWIKVRGFGDSAGPYDFSVSSSTIIPDAAEPNDTRDTAKELALDDLPFSAGIRPAGDRDWFYLSPELIGALLDRLSATSDTTDPQASRSRQVIVAFTESEIDTVMTIYDLTGAERAYNDDGGSGGNARITLPSELMDQGMYVEVAGFGGSNEGDYRLVVAPDTILLDDYEPDDSPTEAALLEQNGSPQRRTFSSDADEDWARIEIPSGSGRVRISVETFGDVDTYMELFTEDVRLLHSDDDSGYGFNARIEEDLEPGVYFIKITALYLESPGAEYSVEARTR